jgi:ribosomal protein L11 methyltransferase
MTTPVASSLYAYKLPCTPELSEPLSDAFSQLEGIMGVMLLYEDDALGQEQPVEIVAYASVNSDVLGATLLETARQLGVEAVTYQVTPIEEADWAESWKQFWHVDAVIEGALTICPSWEVYEPATPQEVVLHLDPGSAFGTGAHDTTRLMLQGLYAEAKEDFQGLAGKTVLDVGCGSGILAIYGAKLGARLAVGVDIDEKVIPVAHANALANHVEAQTVFVDAPVLQGVPLVEGGADLVVANILAPVIIELLPALQSQLKPKGVFWCSGLIASSYGAVVEALEQAGFEAVAVSQSNKWFALRAVAPG